MMKNITSILLIAALSLAVTSCTKVIDVNLDKTKPQLVIVGSVTDAEDTHTIKISNTINIDKDNDFPGVSGAMVTLSDNAGNKEVLKETSPGIYQSTSLPGVPGRTYTLTVVADGNTYTSTSTMPAKVAFDSLGLKEIRTDKPVQWPTVYYRDPVELGNYYQAVEYINGKRNKEIFIESDDFINGKNREAILFSGPDDKPASGDRITVEMLCIDKNVYEYLLELMEVDGSSDVASPANPVTNISNGALGYFSAHTVETKEIIYP